LGKDCEGKNPKGQERIVRGLQRREDEHFVVETHTAQQCDSPQKHFGVMHSYFCLQGCGLLLSWQCTEQWSQCPRQADNAVFQYCTITATHRISTEVWCGLS